MSLNVLLVAAEALPLAKTGGLGDMVSAYADALQEAGVVPTILMPAYPQALESAIGLTEVAKLQGLPGGDGTLLRGAMPDTRVPVLLLRMDHLYMRDGLYIDSEGRDYADNPIRFAALSAAAVAIAGGLPGVVKPDVVHAHDWHTALTPMLMKLAGLTTPSILTIHNLAFQGNYALEWAGQIGIPSSWLTADPTADSIEFYGQLSFMKAGIRFADRITTVSENYAREILTPRFGHLMEGVLQQHRDKLSGITNGIDTGVWNPADDPLITRDFTADDLRGKHACKRELQQMFGLPVDPFVPVVALGSRLTWQKMADLAHHSLAALLETYSRLQVVVLGKGDASIERAMRELAERYPDRVGVHIGYDERRAHVLHAGADILLHGSRFEPCGLTPMYTQRYGTIPVASRVGGLADTIVDAADLQSDAEPALQAGKVTRIANGRGAALALARSLPHAMPAAEAATGFLFDGETVGDMSAAVARAIDAFMRPASWRNLQRNAMRADFTWARPVSRYIALYSALSGVRVSRVPKTRRLAAERAALAANDLRGTVEARETILQKSA